MERPVNSRLYRTAWLVVALPLLLAAFTVTRPAPLPPAPGAVQPEFDSYAAARLARELATLYPDRSPGSTGAPGAARWVEEHLTALGLTPDVDVFSATIPGRGRTELRNVTAVVPGRSRDAIVVVAHRDSTRGRPGTNDNASGTAALLELARGYAATRTGLAGGVSPNHTLVFASTDAGAYGSLGARHLATQEQSADRIVAVLVLDSIASGGRPRIAIAGHGPRSPSPGLVATVSARIADDTGREAVTDGALAQLLDLAFPFSLTEQDAFLTENVPALTVSTEGSRARDGALRSRLDITHLGQVGRSTEAAISSLDAGLGAPQGTSTYLVVRGRVIQGWALALLYVAMLVPFAVATVDFVARLRRRGARLRPALRSYARRLGFWLWAGLLFYVFALLGAWPDGDASAVNPDSEAAGHWPRLALTAYVLVVLASWLVARTRLVRRGPVSDEEELAGMAVPLGSLGAVVLVLIITSPLALLLLLPSAHAWLYLVQVRTRGAALRAGVYVAGLAGPVVLLATFAIRFGLGLDAPWYLAELAAIGYVPALSAVLFLAWVAVASQMLAVVADRYAPYPAPADRPARGPVGSAIAALRRSTRGHRPT